jgi:hypothetical protein
VKEGITIAGKDVIKREASLKLQFWAKPREQV